MGLIHSNNTGLLLGNNRFNLYVFDLVSFHLLKSKFETCDDPSDKMKCCRSARWSKITVLKSQQVDVRITCFLPISEDFISTLPLTSLV